MSYTKTQWTNDTAPAINETNLNKIEQGIYDNDSHIGDLTSLTTTANTDLVSAVNEVDGDIGTLSNLTTTAKTNLVSAINELDSKTQYGSLVVDSIRTKNILDESTIKNGVVSNTGISNSTTRLCVYNFIKVTPSTTYTVSFNTNASINNVNISYFTSASFPRESESGWISNFTFTTKSNTAYILLTFRNSSDNTISTANISNVQLEEGSTATTYKPHQELNPTGIHCGSYRNNANFDVQSASVKVPFTTKITDANSPVTLNTSTNTFTFNRSGTFLILVQVAFHHTTNNFLDIRTNDSVTYAQTTFASNGGYLSFQDLRKANIGDTLSIIANRYSGSSASGVYDEGAKIIFIEIK